MSLRIRRAAPGDAAAISHIAEEAFSETIDTASPHVRQVLERGSTFVATFGLDLVGFVDGFVTISPDGETRYDLDLLAVSAAARDRGIGEALVSRSVAEAGQTSASSLRTLVASRNLPMQRLCARLGFTQAPAGLALYVAAPISIARPTKVEHQAHLIAVTTLAYSGIWLEGMLCQNAIDDARTTASARGFDRIGALVPRDDLALVQLLTANNFNKIDDFDWRTLSLRSG